MSEGENAERSCSINIDNSSFERMEKFKYLGTPLTNQNSIQEEIKSMLKSGNALSFYAESCIFQVAIHKFKD
jgi:hypothetical protein